MKVKKSVYNQNLIDFTLQHTGDCDNLIGIIKVNNLEYDKFSENATYNVLDLDNEVITYYMNNKEDVVNGYDISGYTNLYPCATYYTPTTGTPTSVIIPDPNIILENSTTLEFQDWDDVWHKYWGDNPYGDSGAENNKFVYENGTTLTVALIENTTLEKPLIPGDYKINFTISADEYFTGSTFLGGYTVLDDNNEAFYYESGSTTSYEQTLTISDSDIEYINDNITFLYNNIPSSSTVNLEYIKIYFLG